MSWLGRSQTSRHEPPAFPSRLAAGEQRQQWGAPSDVLCAILPNCSAQREGSSAEETAREEPVQARNQKNDGPEQAGASSSGVSLPKRHQEVQYLNPFVRYSKFLYLTT